MFELFEQYFTDDLNRVQKLPIREVKQYGLNMFEFFDIVLELEGLFPDYISIDGYTGVRGDLNSAKANNDSGHLPLNIGLIFHKKVLTFKRRINKEINLLKEKRVGAVKKKPEVKIKKIGYDVPTKTLTVNNKKIDLTQTSHCAALSKAIFKYELKEVIEWDVLYERVFDEDPLSGHILNPERRLYDTYLSLNKRIKEGVGTDQKFLTKTKKTYKRNF